MRFLYLRYRIVQGQRWRMGPRGILEREDAVVADFFKEAQCRSEIRFRLSREPHNHICCDADWAPGGFHPIDAFQILFAAVEALHGVENARRSALDGQMHMIAKGRHTIDSVDNILSKVPRVRCREAHAPDP